MGPIGTKSTNLFVMYRAPDIMAEEITLVEVPPIHVLGIRRKGHYSIIPVLLGQIFEFAMRNRVHIAGMPTFLLHAKSHEEAVETDQAGTADIEVVVAVEGTVRAGGEIRSYSLPGGKMARLIHRGPYEETGQSYQRIMDWIAKKGLHVNGPIREIYHNNPMEVKPEDICTEILVPVG